MRFSSDLATHDAVQSGVFPGRVAEYVHSSCLAECLALHTHARQILRLGRHDRNVGRPQVSTCDDAQKRRLAAAVRADHREALAAAQRQAEVREELPLAIVGAADALQGYQRLAQPRGALGAPAARCCPACGVACSCMRRH
jgi:hypothetical protein